MGSSHISVMTREVLFYLQCSPGKIIADCTLGGAGHAGAIAEKITPGGLLIGIDRDEGAVYNARRTLAGYGDAVHMIHGNFTGLPRYLADLDIAGVDGIVADLGISLDQLESGGRGFSFKKKEPLDMRMNPHEGIPAAHLVNTLKENELIRIFREYGEERWAKRIAGKIVFRRKTREIVTSAELADIVFEAVPKQGAGHFRIHPATRVFMALRIAVNRELENIAALMDTAAACLKPGGRICVISFHSLEDRIVKQRMKAMAKGCVCPPKLPVCQCDHRPQLRILTRRAVRPEPDEVARNPMSRSAVLRAAEKLE